jgi:hypothetical protein
MLTIDPRRFRLFFPSPFSSPESDEIVITDPDTLLLICGGDWSGSTNLLRGGVEGKRTLLEPATGGTFSLFDLSVVAFFFPKPDNIRIRIVEQAGSYPFRARTSDNSFLPQLGSDLPQLRVPVLHLCLPRASNR